MSLGCELAIPLSDLTYADLSTGVDVAGRAASADIATAVCWGWSN